MKNVLTILSNGHQSVNLAKTITGIFREFSKSSPCSKSQFCNQQNYFYNNNQISFVSSYKINHIRIEHIFDYVT